MEKAFSELGLTTDQTRLMFGFQHQLIENDIAGSDSKKEEKQEWCAEWLRSVNEYINALEGSGDSTIPTGDAALHRLSTEVVDSVVLNNKTPLYLILLEVTLFHPYYPLKEGEKPPKLKYKRNMELIQEVARNLKISIDMPEKYISSYNKAIKGITGFWPKMIAGALIGAIIVAVTAGLAAPLIAGLFAPAGLFGAAATSAGLAALGGGAIAVGGAGMAGGIAVIVGGGAILGLGSGMGVGRLLSLAPQFTLTQAAKLEVVMREITLTAQKDVRVAQEIIKEQRETLRMLDDKLFELKGDREKNKKEITNLEKSISHLRKAIERNRSLAESHQDES